MRLVLMGDLHYHEIDETIPGLAEARTAFYHTFLDRFLEMDADYHISLGDLTNYGSTEELREVYKLLNREDRTFIHVLGNHDLYGQTRNQVLEITGQQRYHAIETDSAMLVFLDTAKEMDYSHWGGWIDEEQLAWLEEMVVASGSKPLLVFGHHPVYGTTRGSMKEKGSIDSSIDMWRILNQKKGIGVYFNGHTHMDSIVTQSNWIFVQLSACLDQHVLRVVEITEEEIGISAIDIHDPAVVDHAPILHEHMNYFTHNPDARGNETDRELIVSLLSVVQSQ